MTEVNTHPMHHYHHTPGYGGNYGYGADRGNSLDSLILSNHVGSGHQAISDQIHTASVNGIKETSEAARDTVDAVRDSIEATNQLGNINLQATERNGGEVRTVVERAAGVIRDQLGAHANQSARDQARTMEELCQVRTEMSQQHGAVVLKLTEQHCDLAAKLAECCCELKQENAQTRELIRAQALDECRRRESDLQNEVNLLKITASVASAA